MSPEQFKTTSFVYGMKVLYKGEEIQIMVIDFEDEEILLRMGEEYEFSRWFKFSEVELIKE
jgi:hypothetical protein